MASENRLICIEVDRYIAAFNIEFFFSISFKILLIFEKLRIEITVRLKNFAQEMREKFPLKFTQNKSSYSNFSADGKSGLFKTQVLKGEQNKLCIFQ